jgi:hypothetical protein
VCSILNHVGVAEFNENISHCWMGFQTKFEKRGVGVKTTTVSI